LSISLSSSFASPAPQVVSVESHAKKVGRNEPKLSSAHSDNADYDAVGPCDYPTLP
jgi:hypothetical protein